MKAYVLGRQQLESAGIPCLACRELVGFDLAVTEYITEVDKVLSLSANHPGFFDLTKVMFRLMGQAGYC